MEGFKDRKREGWEEEIIREECVIPGKVSLGWGVGGGGSRRKKPISSLALALTR